MEKQLYDIFLCVKEKDKNIPVKDSIHTDKPMLFFTGLI